MKKTGSGLYTNQWSGILSGTAFDKDKAQTLTAYIPDLVAGEIRGFIIGLTDSTATPGNVEAGIEDFQDVQTQMGHPLKFSVAEYWGANRSFLNPFLSLCSLCVLLPRFVPSL